MVPHLPVGRVRGCSGDLYYTKLIQENNHYSYWADYSYCPDEQAEEISADGAIIREFIADNIHWNYPTYNHGCEETADW